MTLAAGPGDQTGVDVLGVLVVEPSRRPFQRFDVARDQTPGRDRVDAPEDLRPADTVVESLLVLRQERNLERAPAGAYHRVGLASGGRIVGIWLEDLDRLLSRPEGAGLDRAPDEEALDHSLAVAVLEHIENRSGEEVDLVLAGWRVLLVDQPPGGAFRIASQHDDDRRRWKVEFVRSARHDLSGVRVRGGETLQPCQSSVQLVGQHLGIGWALVSRHR